MAYDVNRRVEDAFETLVSMTEKSADLRKDLKNNICISVSTIRKEFFQMKVQLQNVNDENKNINEEVKSATKKAATRRYSHTARQVALFLHHRQQPERGVRQVLPPERGRRKFYADEVKNQEEKRFRMTLKAKDETLHRSRSNNNQK